MGRKDLFPTEIVPFSRNLLVFRGGIPSRSWRIQQKDSRIGCQPGEILLRHEQRVVVHGCEMYTIHALPKSKPKKKFQACVCICVCLFVCLFCLTPHSHKLHVYMDYIYKHICPKISHPTKDQNHENEKKNAPPVPQVATAVANTWSDFTHLPHQGRGWKPPAVGCMGSWREKSVMSVLFFSLCGGMLNIAADLAFCVEFIFYTAHI